MHASRQACLATSRLTSVAKRGAAVSGTRALFPAGLGGWPVGGGRDITGRLVPWASLTTSTTTTSAATFFTLSAAAFFRVAFTFGSGLAGLVLFTGIGLSLNDAIRRDNQTLYSRGQFRRPRAVFGPQNKQSHPSCWQCQTLISAILSRHLCSKHRALISVLSSFPMKRD
jgi:hypothetical protein